MPDMKYVTFPCRKSSLLQDFCQTYLICYWCHSQAVFDFYPKSCLSGATT